MTAGVTQAPLGRPEQLGRMTRAVMPKIQRPSHWLALMSLLIFVTTAALLMSETPYLAGDPIASAFRFGVMGLLVVMVAFRPRDRIALRELKKFDAFGIAFCVLAFASVLYSGNASLTILRSTGAALLYGAVFWTIWFYADVVGGRKVANILLLVVALFFVVGIGSAFVTESAWLVGRYRGVLANPNAVGMLAILFSPLFVVRAMRTRRLTDYAMLFILVISIVLSGSRNGVMTTTIALAFLALRLKAWKIGLFLTAAAIAVYLAMPDYTPAPGMAATSITHILSTDKLANGGGRFEAWQVAIPIIESKIFLGHGFGTEDLIFQGMKFRIHRGAYIHNSYLGLTYQLGLAGSLLVFLPLLGLLAYRLRGHGFKSAQTAAYEAMLLGGLVAAFFESWVYSAGNAFAFPFWTCVMLLTRAAMGAPDSRDPVPPPRRPVIVRPLTRMRSSTPPIGPLKGLVPVARNATGATRPQPPRFDPPPLTRPNEDGKA